ncbi:expressed unknown protein [Seminavis robusta]|uniref:PDZ domain-containing protein n=1 Tax=Seminavis robusta TaxID=568900 RepID=A0A9N8DG48_9STRA|nr:expressed unknown protein [Seminavis robusta]|eukprot:Sro128_g061240.1 n/a (1045) ;mRNA; f:59542-62676
MPTMQRMIFLLSLVSLMVLTNGNTERTRHVYTVRSPNVDRRRAVEIIDLGTFLLTNSEDGRPKTMAPFYLTIAETREDLSEGAIKNVEYATSDFLLAELNNNVFEWDSVANVDVQIVSQERVIEEIADERNLKQVRGGRHLRSVPGSQFEVNVNVTFDREPSPDAAEVDQSMQRIMQDLTFMVDNITASEDPELGYVFMAYRQELSANNEIPTNVVEINKGEREQDTGTKSVTFILPIFIALVILGAIVALWIVKRKRRRVQAANQKAQEDLAFLDEETNVFSFENSPTKSSARKRAYGIDTNEYDGEEDGYSASQGSLNSPSYGMISGIGSPTARSSLSGAETVKISNARLMPLPSKLTELASTSLFAFSEEDEDYEDSTEESQRTTKSEMPSDVSNGSSFNRIMNGKSEEEADEGGISSINSSPQNVDTSKKNSPAKSVTPTDLQGSKGTIASFFSSHFFSSDSVSHFNGSSMTQPAGNTSEAIKRKAARNGVRSFSLSPRRRDPASPGSVMSPRAKSDTGGDDDASADSVFDFLSPSPRRNLHRDEKTDAKEKTGGDNATGKTSSQQDAPPTPSSSNAVAADSSDSIGVEATVVDKAQNAVCLTPTGSASCTPTHSEASTPKATTPSTPSASPSAFAAVTAALLGSVTETKSTTATPPTVMKSNVTKKVDTSTASNNSSVASRPSDESNNTSSASEEEEGTSSLNPIRYLKKVGVIPRAQKPAPTVTNPQANLRHYTPESSQDQYDEDMSEEDSMSDAAPGSFPRRSRRHAKSTTHDGTFAYQTNAMQPQDWSMTDGFSDDDTLSEQGGGAAFGAFPKTGLRTSNSPKSSQKKPGEKSPSNQSRSSYSAVTQNSPASKADSSQASASRQLINDLVWLSKKIAGVKQSAVDSAPGETLPLGAPPQIETVDSLSYASQDGLISPTSAGPGTNASAQRTPIQSPTSTGKANTSIVCRDCQAPPGKLNIVIHSTKDGPAVHEVKDGSCLEGKIFPGDLIIAVDDIDTRAFTAAQLMKTMSERSQSERKITVLHFEEVDESDNTEE